MSKLQINMGKLNQHKHGRITPARWRSNRIRCFKEHNPQCGNCTFCRYNARKLMGRPEKMYFYIKLIKVCFIKDSMENRIAEVFGGVDEI